MSFVDVYGPRLIATVWLDLVRRTRLLTYIRLPEAARYIVAASPDGFPRASASLAPRHWLAPCRSTNQVQDATGRVPFPSPARLLQSPWAGSLLIVPAGRSAHRCLLNLVVGFAPRQDGPDDPGVLVGKSDGDNVRVPAFPHPADPLTSGVILAVSLAKNGSRAVDHQGSQVAIAAFADPKQPGFSTAGSLPRHQPQPRSELAAVPEA